MEFRKVKEAIASLCSSSARLTNEMGRLGTAIGLSETGTLQYGDYGKELGIDLVRSVLKVPVNEIRVIRKTLMEVSSELFGLEAVVEYPIFNNTEKLLEGLSEAVGHIVSMTTGAMDEADLTPLNSYAIITVETIVHELVPAKNRINFYEEIFHERVRLTDIKLL